MSLAYVLILLANLFGRRITQEVGEALVGVYLWGHFQRGLIDYIPPNVGCAAKPCVWKSARHQMLGIKEGKMKSQQVATIPPLSAPSLK